MTEGISTRQLILNAAAHIFLERGYERTSIDLIATQAGVGRRTVYNLFENKKQLFDGTVANLWEQHNPLAKIVASLDEASSPEDGLTRIGQSIAQFWLPEQGIALARMVICEGTRFPEVFETFLAVGRRPAQEAVKGYIERLHSEGHLDVADADFARNQFVDLIIGQVAWNRLLGEPETPSKELLDRVVLEAVRMFMARYRASGLTHAATPERVMG